MLLVYMSLSGQTRKFVKKTGMPVLEINATNPFVTVDEDYLMIVPTYDIQVTDIMNDFIEHEDNLKYCKGVLGGGNRNFAELYCFTAKDISEKYNVPVIHMFEFQGSKNDLQKLREEVDKLESNVITN